MEKRLIQFGVDELHIAKLTKDDSTGFTYDSATLTRLEGCQNVTITEISSEYTLQGDNGTVDIRTVNEGYEIEISYGVLTYDQLKLLQSGTLVENKDATTGAVLSRKYITKATDRPEYFGIIASVDSSFNKTVLAKCKVVSIEIPHSSLEHAVVTISAKALKRTNDGVMRILHQDGSKKAAAVADFNA